MKKIIRVGSRESKLAMVQTNIVVSGIKKKYPNLEFEIVGINTKGDVLLDSSLDKIGGKGLFIKELENALIQGSIDMAVHSMKDMPAVIPEELTIAAVSKREDPRDVLITDDGKTLEQLEAGKVIGTSSLRREVQLLQKRPDLQLKNLRGNVITRLNKLMMGEFDAIILAVAGLKRLKMESRCVQIFPVDELIPAVGQGALAVETRKGEDMDFLLESIHDEEAALAVNTERAFMIRLNGNCSTPIAAHAVVQESRIKLYGLLAKDDLSKVYRDTIEGSKDEAELLAVKLADLIKKRIENNLN